MTDKTSYLSQRGEARAAAKAHRAKRVRRGETSLNVVVSGYSHRRIANVLSVSLATVRREVDKARGAAAPRA